MFEDIAEAGHPEVQIGCRVSLAGRLDEEPSMAHL
jgi:hypothetical protein